MGKQLVKDLKKGDIVDSFFAVVKKDPVKPYKKGYMFIVQVSDISSQMIVKYWGGTDENVVKQVFSSFDVQQVVKIKGTADEYQGNIEVSINPTQGGEITKTNSFDEKELIPTSKKDIEQMKRDLRQIIEDIKNNDIKRLLKDFFDNDDFLNQFAKAPAASSRHHNYLGGLIEHVLSLIDISKNIVKLHSKLDIDLLIAGCIFHDIGKIKEYELGLTINYTSEGKLFGHISIGQKMVAERIERLDSFSEITAQKIIHMILSHHGQLDWGSPVKPAFPEAIALHYIDQVDAKIKGVFQEIEKVNSDEDWSAWTKDYGSLYLK